MIFTYLPTSPFSRIRKTARLWTAIFCLVMGADLVAAGTSSEGEGTSDLSAGPTVISFDQQTGAILQITHRETGLKFVEPGSVRSLFSLILSQPYEGRQMGVDASDFSKVSLERSDEGAIEIGFTGHGSLPLSVRVTAASGQDGLAHLRIAVNNKSQWALKAIRFPQFVSPPALGKNPTEDRLLFPLRLSDGAVIWAPGTITQTQASLYPNQACVQFAALYNKTAGMYLASYDSDGHYKQWSVKTVKDRSVEILLDHFRPEVPGVDEALPYDVVLGTFAGDWRTAADIYKQWAVQQPWCSKKLAERTDIPGFLKEGTGVIVSDVNRQDVRTATIGRQLERLPEFTDAYRRRGELAHMIFVPYGWENRGKWAGINYFPTVPSDEAWRKAIKALAEQGDRACFLTSGYWWVVKRQNGRNGPAFDDTADFERRKEMTIQNQDGTTWFIDKYADPSGSLAWRGLSTELCHGSPEASKTLLDIFLRIAGMGVPIISFDQEIGGAQRQPCYSKTHGHPPGYGNWMWTDFRDLCVRILKEGKPIQPELSLAAENCSELTIPYFGTYWSRQFGVIDHGATNAHGVGLFSYLYHEYITAIGAACVQGQGAKGAQTPMEMRCYALANNLVLGLIPGPFSADVRLEPTDAWHKTVSQAFFSYCRPYARFPEYLTFGSARRPPAIECANVDVPFYRDTPGTASASGGRKILKTTVSLPAVAVGSFAAADGSVGTVIVNATATAQQAKVKLEAPGKSAALYQANRQEENHWKEAPAEIPVSLEPFGVRMLVLR